MTTTGDVTPEMVLQMRQEIADLQGNVYALQQFANASDPAALKPQVEEMFDMKINTAMAMAAVAVAMMVAKAVLAVTWAAAAAREAWLRGAAPAS